MKKLILAIWNRLKKDTIFDVQRRPYHSPAKRVMYMGKIKSIEKRSLREHGLEDHMKKVQKELSKRKLVAQ